jgi:nicotinamide-nucleotide amidase
VAVTGVAGPSGGSAEKPVGTVWIAVGQRLQDSVRASAALHCFAGHRREVREASVVESLRMLMLSVESAPVDG